MFLLVLTQEPCFAGGGGGHSNALLNAINRANAAGILFIAAAGNEGDSIVPHGTRGGIKSYPASYTTPNVITVAAINSTGSARPVGWQLLAGSRDEMCPRHDTCRCMHGCRDQADVEQLW